MMESSSGREFCANGTSMDTAEVEAKLDQGNIQDAETALRDGLSLTSEVTFFSCFSILKFIFILN
jgi:tetratricopeptide repeat protein 7